MRATFSDRVERGRDTSTSARGDDYGWFRLRTNDGAELRVLVSAGSDDVPWEHVSVSLTNRCPTWEEMAWVKALFWDDEEAVVQVHPRRSDYVNHMPYCLHLWRPTREALPLPPSIAVGPRPGETLTVDVLEPGEDAVRDFNSRRAAAREEERRLARFGR